MSKPDAGQRKRRGIFEDRPNVFITQTLLRSWYVLLPLIGIWMGGARFIKPNLQKIRDEGTLQRLKNEQQGRGLLNQLNASESVVRAATFERDSVLAPAIGRRLFLVDSLRAIVAGEEAEIAELAAKVDSINAEAEEVAARTADQTASLSGFTAEQARLDSTIAALNDSLTSLKARAAETWERANQRE
jgi:hypothetical protein